MAARQKVAIVCDWLVGTGGAERVVLELHRLFPAAPIFTSQYNRDPAAWYGDNWFDGADVRTGWLDKIPLGLRKFLPVLRAWYFTRLDLSGYDLVISSSGAEAKAVRPKSGAVHISYMHAPTHYYWARYEQYLEHPGFGKLDPLARLGLKLLVGPLRRWDKKAAQRPDYLIANSNFTAKQIKKFYSRGAGVIHPPVDVERFKLLNKSSNPRHGFVAAGRQTPYKRLDLAVEAANQTNLPLTIIGNGPDHDHLLRLAGPSVKFITNATDQEVAELFASAEAFIFPGVDDFGVVAVEALAAGAPVIAYGRGGALDYVNEQTGMLFDEQTAENLATALQKFEPGNYDHLALSRAAQEFSSSNFQKKFRQFIKQVAS